MKTIFLSVFILASLSFTSFAFENNPKISARLERSGDYLNMAKEQVEKTVGFKFDLNLCSGFKDVYCIDQINRGKFGDTEILFKNNRVFYYTIMSNTQKPFTVKMIRDLAQIMISKEFGIDGFKSDKERINPFNNFPSVNLVYEIIHNLKNVIYTFSIGNGGVSPKGYMSETFEIATSEKTNI